MDFERVFGVGASTENPEEKRRWLHLYINLKLAASGQAICISDEEAGFLDIAGDLLKAFREKMRLLSTHYCPADRRIQDFLNCYLDGLGLDQIPSLPASTFILDRHGVARELSLPMGEDEFHSDIVASYRVRQGVLHNPASDRRTTEGSFHIVEGGFPIPGDKKAVPRRAFAAMLEHALDPPPELLALPFTSKQPEPVRMFVSLLLRPVVCPEIPGSAAEKSMEIRFFAPGNLVSNLDFVESIFGNGGNPNLAEFDAGLDVDHWTGTSGCIILAPHLVNLTKAELGLPNWDDATEQQRREGMCWRISDELYNEGDAFKIAARDESGVIITLIADNYYGYCKKEVKTQISFSANLSGLAEEEHAGGALAFQRRSHGDEFGVDTRTRESGYDFAQMVERYGEAMELQPEGHAIDRSFPDLIYVPQDLRMDLGAQRITWARGGEARSIRLQPGKVYMQPNGYKVEMVKHPTAPSWALIGEDPESTFCHKPSTVSGGGKSEISKALDDAVIYGHLFVGELQKDLDRVQEVFDKDYTRRFQPGYEDEDYDPSRQPLNPKRSLGSVIKLLTPSDSFTDEYNEWLKSLPPRIHALVFVIKRFHRPEWGDNWREFLSVDEVDGAPGHELKLDGRRIIGSYLRMGFDAEGKWRTFKVRQDFIAAGKIQMEDDISVSVVIPRSCVKGAQRDEMPDHSVKLIKNCEYRLFQRPDEAIHPGFDKQTEWDLAQPGNFLANFEPLRGDNLAEVAEDVQTLCRFTSPMRKLIKAAYVKGDEFVVSSACPRLVDGKPSKNPRYLQLRADLADPQRKYIADMSTRFHRKLLLGEPLYYPVDAVLTGRRNNPSELGIRSLAVYNPIHYQELPELFMDFICSLTGKSPSTTGAGSEGALTKGPFNALRSTPDLNNALVSFILTGYPGFSSPAGHIGPNVRVDHDISLLIPEIWARLAPAERTPAFLIGNGYLKEVLDFEHNGRVVFGSRLGYRITARFVHDFLGKIFDNPNTVFTDEILRPEVQGMELFVDGINNIVEAQQREAQRYLDDGSVEDACPPLRALLHIMATGEYRGMDAHHPEFRAMFTRKYLLDSGWYRERLEIQQQRDIALWHRHVQNLQQFLHLDGHTDVAEQMRIGERLDAAQAKLAAVEKPGYPEELAGGIGADPLGSYRSVE